MGRGDVSNKNKGRATERTLMAIVVLAWALAAVAMLSMCSTFSP